MNKPTTVPCPTCGTQVPWTRDQVYRPFCSERCRLIDLGEWLEERRSIPGEEQPMLQDEDEERRY